MRELEKQAWTALRQIRHLPGLIQPTTKTSRDPRFSYEWTFGLPKTDEMLEAETYLKNQMLKISHV